MKKHLNDQIVSNLKNGPTYIVWDTLPTFGIRVGRTTKTWVLKRNNRYHVIGRYPVVSLKQARDQAKRLLLTQYIPETAISSEEAINRFLTAKKLTQRHKSHYLYTHTLKNYFPRLSMHQVRLQDLQAAIGKLKPSHANLTQAIFSSFLNWSVQNQIMANNPLKGHTKPHRLTSRDRLLTDEEVKLIWRETFHHCAFGNIVKLLILTGQRLSQITHLEHTWIQHDRIVFPASVMKSNQEHVIPLTPMMQAEIYTYTKNHRYVWIKPITSISGGMAKLRVALDVPHWTLHDTRRYFSSTMASLQVPIDITEAILDHRTGSRSQIQRIYDRPDRLPQMRHALARYEAHITTLLDT